MKPLNQEFKILSLTIDKNINKGPLIKSNFEPFLSSQTVGTSLILNLFFFNLYSKSTSKAHLVIPKSFITSATASLLNSLHPHWLSEKGRNRKALTTKLNPLFVSFLIKLIFSLLSFN